MSPPRTSAGLASLFGALELRVLEAVWRRDGEVSVRDLVDDFPNAAYTTLMTTLARLHRKGVLSRRVEGRAHLYRPVQTRQELESSLVSSALEPVLASGGATPILSMLVDQVSRHDERLLDELERLVRAKRKAEPRP